MSNRPTSSRFGGGVTPQYRTSRLAKTFALRFNMADAVARQHTNLDELGRKITLEELSNLGKYVLTPVYHDFAPEKQGWAKRHLKDTIRAVRDRINLGITIQMAWYGKLTTEGRGGLPARDVYKLELPGGITIWRTHVGRATTRQTSDPLIMQGTDANGRSYTTITAPPFDPSAAAKRMRWAKDAYETVVRDGWFRQYAKNIAERLNNELLKSLQARFPNNEEFRETPTSSYKPLKTQRGVQLQHFRAAGRIRARVAREDVRFGREKARRLLKKGKFSTGETHRVLKYETRRQTHLARADRYDTAFHSVRRRHYTSRGGNR